MTRNRKMAGEPMTRAEEETMVREIYDNFPEASMSIECICWWYRGKPDGDGEGFDFRFVDHEDGKRYRVGLDQAIVGLRKFFAAVDRGELRGLGLPSHYKSDLCTWDADAFDACLQFAIFGEVIYG